MTAAVLVGGIVLIVAGAELFTNAIEWAGFCFRLSQGATGSLLAAIGAALPETFVPIIALATHSPSADSVATGAVLGAPFLLLTLGVALTGAAVMARREAPSLSVDPRQARRDLGFFLAAFAVAVAAIALPQAMRVAVGAGLLATYGFYVWRTLRGGTHEEGIPEPLHLLRPWSRGTPPLALVALQVAAAVALLLFGSHLFVRGIDDIAGALHANPLIVALVLVPIATELPETINSVIWVRSGDDALAFGNVVGGSIFQACILGFIGVTFTTWRPGLGGVASTIPTLVTAAALLLLMRNGRCRGRWLVLAALPWAAYVCLVVLALNRLGG